MKNRNVAGTFLLIILLLAFFVVRRWKEPKPTEILDRHPAHLTYTKHARCRMDCRHITEAEIEELIEKGSINYSKSHRDDQPCPTIAVQGLTSAGHNLRVIFGQCSTATKVITCYNLNEDFVCNCPGDKNKNE